MMLVSAYKTIGRFGSTVVAEIDTVNIPAQAVAKQSFWSSRILPHPGAVQMTAQGVDLRQSAGDIHAKMKIRFENGSVRLVDGVIFYESVTEVLNFLLTRYVPTGATPYDAVITEVQEGVPCDRTQFENLVLDSERPSRSMHHRRRGRRIEPVSDERRLPLVKTSKFLDESGQLFSSGGSEFWVSHGHANHQASFAVLPTSFKVQGRAVPRWATLTPTDSWSTERRDARAVSYGHFDGKNFQWLTSFSDLPPTAYEAFDREGMLYGESEIDLMPYAHVEARCLVRIPPRAELLNVLTLRARPRKPRYATLRNPGLLYDTRCPVPLTANVPVIDSPEAAAFVLSHGSNGIYVPQDTGFPYPFERAPDEESFIAVCNPRVFA